MKILMVLGPGDTYLNLFSHTIVNMLSDADSIQVMPVGDVSPAEWQWADWLVMGTRWDSALDTREIEDFIAALPNDVPSPKTVSIFQIQSREDPPISGAYGYGLARKLCARGMTLLAPPSVFFKSNSFSELEGELLRAANWLAALACDLDASSTSTNAV